MWLFRIKYFFVVAIFVVISLNAAAQSPFEVNATDSSNLIDDTRRMIEETASDATEASTEILENIADGLEDFFSNPFNEKPGEKWSISDAYEQWLIDLNKDDHTGPLGALRKLWFALTHWHFEGRFARNGPHPTYEEAMDPANGWILLPASMSIYHDNGWGEPELKFIHPSGSEAVFTKDLTGEYEPYLDPEYIATYNYINPATKPKSVWNPISWLSFAGKGIGHVIVDVIPYKLLGGNVRKHERKAARAISRQIDDLRREIPR